MSSLSSCINDEPAIPCGELDLSPLSSRAQFVSEPSSTLLVMSDGNNGLTVLRDCPQYATCEAEVVQDTIPIGNNPDQLLLTATGRWLTYRVGSTLFRIDLDEPEPTPLGTAAIAHELVGSLKSGDWVVYRRWNVSATDIERAAPPPGSPEPQIDDPELPDPPGGEGGGTPLPSPFDEGGTPPTSQSELWALYVGDLHQDPQPQGSPDSQDIARPHFRIGSDLDLRIAAVGHQHIVARHLLGNGEEVLYSIRLADLAETQASSNNELGVAEQLTSGARFTRVLLTETYAQDGSGALDLDVIATSGSGDDARTLIFDAQTGAMAANFAGAVVTSPVDLADAAGMSAVSPDGSHLAYITQSGGLALYSLGRPNLTDAATSEAPDPDEVHGSCLVRSSSNADHQTAGFAADGTLYFSSRELVPDPHAGLGLGDRIYAYDAEARAFTPLTDRSDHFTIKAIAPHLHREAPDADPIPWAIIGSNGCHTARPKASPEVLGLHDVSFLPRPDGSMWLLEGVPGEGPQYGTNQLILRRLTPRIGGESSALELEISETSDPDVMVDDQVHEQFVHEYSSHASVCVSVSQRASSTTPWSSHCSSPRDPTAYADNGLPLVEQDTQ